VEGRKQRRVAKAGGHPTSCGGRNPDLKDKIYAIFNALALEKGKKYQKDEGQGEKGGGSTIEFLMSFRLQ